MNEATNSPRNSARGVPYGRVYVVLALATALELALASTQLAREFRTPAFLVLSLAKAGMVAAFYMHLRRDSRTYSYIFLFPAAMLVLFILLTLAI